MSESPKPSKPINAKWEMTYIVQIIPLDTEQPFSVRRDGNYPEMDFAAIILGRTFTGVKTTTPLPLKPPSGTPLPIPRIYSWWWRYKDRIEALGALEELANNGFYRRAWLLIHRRPVKLAPPVPPPPPPPKKT